MLPRRILGLRRRRNPLSGKTLVYAGLGTVVAYMVASTLDASTLENPELAGLVQAVQDHPVGTGLGVGALVLLYSVAPGPAHSGSSR